MRPVGTTPIGNTRRLFTAEQMREMDRRATDDYGVPSLLLMENAGKAVADEVVDLLGNRYLQKVIVVTGSGNNGGDGFVAARHLHNGVLDVRVFHFGDRASAKGDALTNIEMAEKTGIPIDYTKNIDQLREELSDCDCVIDALLGTGARGDLKPEYANVVKLMNTHRGAAPLIAVDIPSGLDADSGLELGPVGDDMSNFGWAAVRADVTVTFGLPKVGLVTYPGAWYVGELAVADIGLPSELTDSIEPTAFLLGDAGDVWAKLALQPRKPDSHKGTFGHTAIVAGSVGMTGAATLSAEGALRIGTGLVTVLVPESLNDIMEVKLTEAMTIPVPQGRARAFGMASLDAVLGYVNRWDSAVIGPGFGRDEDTIEFAQELIKRIEKPAIIDADALYAVSRDLSVLSNVKAPLVITPHPGEMATLMGATSAEVQSNRLEIARSFAKEHNVTVVLKGAGTVIADPEGKAYINTTGTPGMATGGTGDVLSGMIGGLLAQSKGAISSANAAVYLHGLAGEIAARKRGETAMLASDLADCIGDALREVESGK